MPAHKRVRAEAAAGTVEREEEQHHRQEHIGPWPFSRITWRVDAKPEVQHEDDGEYADQPRSEPEDQRDGEGELSEEDDRIEYVKIRQIEVCREIPLKIERSAVSHLLDPELQAVGNRERQLPQHPLEPHPSNHHPDQPRRQMSTCALRWVIPPVLHG